MKTPMTLTERAAIYGFTLVPSEDIPTAAYHVDGTLWINLAWAAALSTQKLDVMLRHEWWHCYVERVRIHAESIRKLRDE